MRKMCLVILLCAFLVVCSFALATSSIPERNQESEQRIDSMMVNQSFGNMTGEDYIIALMNAYINASVNDNAVYPQEFYELKDVAASLFPEYSRVYDQLESKFSNMMFASIDWGPGPRYARSGKMAMPRQGMIDLYLYRIFHNDTECRMVYPDCDSFDLSEDLNEARAEYQTRIAEEAELKAKQEKREADRLRKQQEDEARQAALDAYYKALFENTTKELTNLVNESESATNSSIKEAKLLDALILINDSSANLVSPYRNMLAIYSGNILVKMSMLKDNRTNALNIISALERYEYAQTNFTYSNESEDYQNAIYEDFFDEWDPIIQMRTGIAEDRLKEELYAMVTDLRDAPNVKQLLSGHINKKYEITVANYTEPMLITALEASGYPYEVQPGYWVQINLSGYNDPKISDTDFEEIDEYMNKNIPTCIDIFSLLFSDDRISVVVVQLNRTYYDRFGNTEETRSMSARLDNLTAKEIGDWTTFKKYVGTDMDRFRQVVDVY